MELGKKESDQILVTYPEKNLQPFTKYYWKVNVWDKDGKRLLRTSTASRLE